MKEFYYQRKNMKINIMQNTSIWLGDKLYNLGYF